MRRREFIVLVGGTVAVWPLALHAQQPKKIPRVGVLWHAGSAEEEAEYLFVLIKAFNDLGYIDGKTIQLEHRFPAEQPERFRALARDLVESKVDLIIAVAGIGGKEAKQATSTIPIVLVADPDPVGNGLADSLARPGGNVTGLSLMAVDLSGKRLGLLREIVPNLSRFAIIVDPRDVFSMRIRVGYENTGKAQGIFTQVVAVSSPEAIDQAFAAIARDGFDGAVVIGPMLLNDRVRVGAAALAHKIPTLAGVSEMVPHGLLLSYGPDIPDYFRKAVGYADKVLKGARPADLPIEQPTRFRLVVNLKIAKALGLTVPNSLLINADEVIE
jgi:putative tryptophan/tyrosine transport system substrate-binding protein